MLTNQAVEVGSFEYPAALIKELQYFRSIISVKREDVHLSISVYGVTNVDGSGYNRKVGVSCRCGRP
jgi:hypothetical protein